MKEEKKNIQFTIEHIRKYLDGELSGPDMHALEKAALDDPFLADAIEGFEVSRKHSGPFKSDMADLQNRLTERITQKKRKNRTVIQMKWPVAASILFVAGATLFTFNLITRKTNAVKIAAAEKKDSHVIKSQSLPNAAAVKTEIESQNPEAVRKDTTSVASDQYIAKEQMSSGKKTKNTIQQDISSVEDLKKSATSANSVYHTDIDSLAHPDPYKKYDNKDQEVSPAAVVRPAQVLSGKTEGMSITQREISSKTNPTQKYIAGVVVNEKQEPIQNATVSLLHSEKEITTTDSNGYFKLYLNNSKSVGRIVVNYVGYQSISRELQADSSFGNTIQLQPASMALNDVVVMGYGKAEDSENDGLGSQAFSKSKAANSSLPDSLVNKHAAPEKGWKAYYGYLEENKKILSADSILKGTEIVTFQVNAGGQPSNFKIIESVSPAHDAEIIRLVKVGPGWKINKGKKQICRVSLHFK
jgi:hypothetical protein